LSWDGAKHQAKIVCNHPYTDPARFSAFLSVLPQAAERDVATGKPYLQWPDRLFGASPYERIMQHEGTILVLYRIPEDDRNPYINLYLPKALQWHAEKGWLFADAGGFYVAIRIIGEYSWEEIREAVRSNIMVRDGDLIDGWLLKINELNGGIALEAVESGRAGAFEKYKETRASDDVDLTGWAVEGLAALNTWDGVRLSFSYDGAQMIDGREIDYTGWPLYGAPWVDAPLGTGTVQIRYGGEVHDIDFGIDPSLPLIPMRIIG
jgi:hypothetical protein